MSIKNRLQRLEKQQAPTDSAYMLIDASGRVLGSPPEINGMIEPEALQYLDRLGVRPENITARRLGVDFEL